MAEKGWFIVLEGIDNCGKTTQSNYLREFFESKGRKVIQTREPGGTEVGEEIRTVLLKDRPQMIDPVSQTLLFYAARQEFLKQVVKPRLDAGFVVLSDRFEASSYVYQGAVQNVPNKILDFLHSQVVAKQDCIPDIYFILDLPAQESFKRDTNPDNKQQVLVYEKQGLEFREKLRNGYLEYGEKNGIIIDASRPKDEIFKHLKKILSEKGVI